MPARGRYCQWVVGKVYGRLTVVARSGTKWLCRCQCGNESVVDIGMLNSGDTQSCGCLQKERASRAQKKHGLADKVPEYRTWNSMRMRCRNPKSKDYPRYGGRGITICDRWNDFSNFYADMGKRPSLKHTIDRIDNDGNYEPSNCRWATPKEQRYNVPSTKHPVCGFGTVKEAADAHGARLDRVYVRLGRGWKEKDALTVPKYGRQSHHEM